MDQCAARTLPLNDILGSRQDHIPWSGYLPDRYLGSTEHVPKFNYLGVASRKDSVAIAITLRRVKLKL